LKEFLRTIRENNMRLSVTGGLIAALAVPLRGVERAVTGVIAAAMRRGKRNVVAAVLLTAFCAGQSNALDHASPDGPVAARKPHQVLSPYGARDDEYYWLRDDTRQSPDVLDYLNRETAYRDAVMAPTDPLRQTLYDELVGRIKPDDSTVPVYEHGYWYYTRFEPGLDYPVYARRKGSMKAPERVMLDGNRMAKGHEYFQIGDTQSSPTAGSWPASALAARSASGTSPPASP